MVKANYTKKSPWFVPEMLRLLSTGESLVLNRVLICRKYVKEPFVSLARYCSALSCFALFASHISWQYELPQKVH